MSSDDQSEKECPLCMEPLEIDDLNFYPCKCEYQICRFCWHRLRTDDNGLCPACRQPYPENPVNFKPLSASDVQKIKSEKKQKQQQQRIKISESRKHLASYRVLQKNLVYVVGLSSRVADPDILKKPEFFGKYGRIVKIVVGSSPSTAAAQSASSTAYVTYARYEDALRAIQAVNNAQLDGRIVKASLGTTKYCSSFLRSQPCHKPECMYLHDVADSEVSFTKDDMHQGKHAEYERKLIEMTLNKEKAQREGGGSVNSNTNRWSYPHSRSAMRDKNVQLKTSLTNKWSKGRANSLTRVAKLNAVEKPHVDTRGSASASPSEECVRTTDERIRPPTIKPTAVSTKDEQLDTKNINDIAKESHVLSKRSCKGDSVDPLLNSVLGNSADVLQKASKSRQYAMPADCARSRLLQWTNQNISASAFCNQAPGGLHDKTVFQLEDDGSKSVVIATTKSNAESIDWQKALGITSSPGTTTASHPLNDTVLNLSSSNSTAPASQHQRHSHMSAHSDDDLGFDPFSESIKGLADLVEEEKSASPPQLGARLMNKSSSSVSSLTSSLMSLGIQCGWPSMAVNRNDITNRSSISSGYPSQFSPSTVGCSGNLNSYVSSSLTSASTAPSDILSRSNPYPYLSDGRQPQQPGLSHLQHYYVQQQQHPPQQSQQQPHSLPSHMLRPHMGNSHSFPDLPPGLSRTAQQRFSPLGMLNSIPQSAVNQADAAQLAEWQEGLKALLPNVNVRFVSDLSSTGYQSAHGGSLSNLGSQSLTHISNHGSCYAPSSGANLLPYEQHGGARSLMTVNPCNEPNMQWFAHPPGFPQPAKR